MAAVVEMGLGGSRLQLIYCFYCTGFMRISVPAAGAAGLFVAALGLLE